MAKKVGKSQRIKTVTLVDLTGGMNVARSPEFLPENECVKLENFEFDIEGDKLRTRRGLGAPLHLFTSQVTHVYNDYEMNDFFIFLKNRKVYRYEFGKTPQLIGTLNGDSERPTCCKFGGNLLIASGSKLQKYNYQELTEITTSPNADIVFERFGRVVVTKTGQDLLIYSAIGNEEDWHENSNDDSARKDVNVGYKDGGDILGVAQLATDLLVFKSNGIIYNVQNEPSEWNITPLGQKSDFISRHALTNLSKDVVFMSTTGLKSYSTSMSYANFEPKDIGDKCNPLLKKQVDNPFVSDLRRTKQLVVSGNSGNTLFVYHYGLKAFSMWTFPGDIMSVCENRYHVLVAMNTGAESGGIYELSWKNTTDNGEPIYQEIITGQLRDTHEMNVYRTYIDIEAKVPGSGRIHINNEVINHSWISKEQQKEFKSQIRAPILQFMFDTTSPIIFKFVSFDIVMERESMVSEGSSKAGGKRGSGFGAKKKSSKHDDFLKNLHGAGRNPYG